MSGNNKIGLLLMVVVWLTACKPMVYIPEAYSFKAKEIKNNPYGCWTSVVIKQADEVSQPTTVAGELLFMETDTLYLLISDRDVWPVYSGSILKAELYTHRNMAGNYLGTTALYLIPNVLGALIYFTEFGGPFLAMGIPVAVIGTLNSIAEGSSRKNVLVYPQKNTLENLSNFARFPAGRPENINLRELKLKPAPAFR